MLAVDAHARPLALCSLAVALLAWSGCYDSTPGRSAQSRQAGAGGAAREDGGQVPGDGAGGASGVGGTRGGAAGRPEDVAADAGAMVADPRCSVFPASGPCDGPQAQGYWAVRPTDVDGAHLCRPVNELGCKVDPVPFATLAECAAACETEVDTNGTACERPDARPAACASDADAAFASLEGQSPYGKLWFDHAWLGRWDGFTSGVSVTFTRAGDGRLGATPHASVRIFGPFDGPDLVGAHDSTLHLQLCDGGVDIPVRVTITIDETSERISDRVEGRIEGLAGDVELSGEFRFTRICDEWTDI